QQRGLGRTGQHPEAGQQPAGAAARPSSDPRTGSGRTQLPPGQPTGTAAGGATSLDRRGDLMSQPREAIALLYDGGPEAPRITAKGEAEMAERIVQLELVYEVPFY